jgi:hypothetical protein
MVDEAPMAAHQGATQGCDMTRENKLALVVGFGLLLFVGILVSDHFSAAHRQESAAFGIASVSESRPSRSITLAPMPAAGAVSLQPQPTAVSGAGIQQVSDVTPISSMPAQARVEPTVAPIGTPIPEPRARVTAQAPAKQESEPGVKMHPIAEGETLYAICKREYGDGSLSMALAKYNRKAIPDPTRIRKGVTIRIPPADVLRPGSAKKQEAAVKTQPEGEVPVAAMAAAEIIAVDSRAPIGGEVTVEVKPQPEPKTKTAAKPAPKQATKKPAKKPVASKNATR